MEVCKHKRVLARHVSDHGICSRHRKPSPTLQTVSNSEPFSSASDVGNWDVALAAALPCDDAVRTCTQMSPCICIATDFSGADMAIDAFSNAISIIAKALHKNRRYMYKVFKTRYVTWS